MKLMSSIKTVSTIALIAMIINTGFQKPASAQAQDACTIASNETRGAFDGVNLTPTQFAAYDKITQEYDTKVVPRLNAKAKRIIKPNAPVGFFIKQTGRNLTPFEQELSIKAGSATPAQIPALNAKYAQYGRFVAETTLVFDQALFEESERESKKLQNRLFAVMNLAQQKQYQKNQDAFKRVNKICGTQDGPFVKVGNTYEMGGSYF